MRVIVSAESFEDGCAWYRSVGPFSALSRAYPDIQVQYLARPSWADVRTADIFFVSRPAEKWLADPMSAARDFGTKVWVDWDDDVFSIPRDNRAYERYAGILPQAQRFIEFADVVTVSTKRLLEKFKAWNANAEVIPNAIDDCLLKHRPSEPPQKIVAWRGTDTHHRDVGKFAREMVDVAKEFSDFKFAFIGSDPAAWLCSELMPDPIRITTPMTPITLFTAMALLRPTVVVVPLDNSEFNLSKSNIAALEASLAGAATLAPGWEEWRLQGVSTYGNPTEFREALVKLLSHPIATTSLAEQAWVEVRMKYLLSDVNKARRSVVLRLCNVAEFQEYRRKL